MEERQRGDKDMFNFNNEKRRKTISAVIIIVIVLAMVGGMVLPSLLM